MLKGLRTENDDVKTAELYYHFIGITKNLLYILCLQLINVE